MIILILRLCLAIVVAYLFGKLVSKIKLPAILGWLITGMILGPHAFGIVNNEVLDAQWYQITLHVLECVVGLLIGTELVWNNIKKTGKQIIITTLTQSLGTFLLVSAVFGVVFYYSGIPLYVALIFGGIALATAPAPALSIVREFKTDGPVTKTLVPMAALDDMVAVLGFHDVSVNFAGFQRESYLFEFGYQHTARNPVQISTGFLAARVICEFFGHFGEILTAVGDPSKRLLSLGFRFLFGLRVQLRNLLRRHLLATVRRLLCDQNVAR